MEEPGVADHHPEVAFRCRATQHRDGVDFLLVPPQFHGPTGVLFEQAGVTGSDLQVAVNRVPDLPVFVTLERLHPVVDDETFCRLLGCVRVVRGVPEYECRRVTRLTDLAVVVVGDLLECPAVHERERLTVFPRHLMFV